MQTYLFLHSLYPNSFLYTLHFIFTINVFFSFYVYDGLTNLNRTFTEFNSLNKNKNSIKMPSCCLSGLVEIRRQDCENPRTNKIFNNNNIIVVVVVAKTIIIK